MKSGQCLVGSGQWAVAVHCPLPTIDEPLSTIDEPLSTMKLTTSIWLVFALCLLLVLAAMGWLSATALRLDRAEVEARRQAVLEEKVRLALWRMDSALAPTVAQESARPYFAYLAYFPADRSFNRMFNSRTKGETLVASPLLVETPPHVLLHFQLDAAGNLTSPQLPGGIREGEAPAEPRKQQPGAEFARLGRSLALPQPNARLKSQDSSWMRRPRQRGKSSSRGCGSSSHSRNSPICCRSRSPLSLRSSVRWPRLTTRSAQRVPERHEGRKRGARREDAAAGTLRRAAEWRSAARRLRAARGRRATDAAGLRARAAAFAAGGCEFELGGAVGPWHQWTDAS